MITITITITITNDNNNDNDNVLAGEAQTASGFAAAVRRARDRPRDVTRRCSRAAIRFRLKCTLVVSLKLCITSKYQMSFQSQYIIEV